MKDEKLKILIVDNEIEICKLLKDFFNFIDYESTYETDGKKVLEELENIDYDILFVDLKLENVSGIEILKKSKSVKPLSEVIVITGFGSDETILQTFQNGASAYIQKPISFTEIKIQTEEALARRRLNLKNEKIKSIIAEKDSSMIKHFQDIIQIDKLYEFLNLTVDIDTLIDSILSGIATIIPDNYYSFLLAENSNKEMVVFSRNDINKGIINNIQGEIVNHFEQLTNVKIEDIYKVRVSFPSGTDEYDEKENNGKWDKKGFSNVFIPILIDNTINGILGVSGNNIKDIEYIQDILRIVSKRISGVIKNATLHRNTKLLALTDGLTGLLNRRAFYERLKSEYERFRRYGSYLSLIVADFDNLKTINDTYGHPFGDEVIKKIGDILRETSRDSDVLARYGGDEFVVILPQTNSENALNMAERIRNKIEINTFILSNKQINCTISVGVATAPDKNIISSEDLLESADRALYQSKRSGKNRVSQFL